MKLKLLSWNVRGTNDSSKRKIIKTFIRNQKVDLLCIQETKIQPMSEGMVRSLGSRRFLDWRALDADGATGGILICLGQKVFGNFGLGGGSILLILQIQEYGRQGCLSVHESLWVVHQKGKGMLVGRDWGD